MAVYWSLFLSLASVALFERSREISRNSSLFLFIFCFACTVILGTRFDLGVDWNTYYRMFELAQWAPIEQVLARNDPGYMFINWVVAQLGLGFWAVNLICSVIFCVGLYLFCRERRYPLMSALIAVPYLIIVVGIGYTRQSAAIGLFFLAILSIERGKIAKYLFWVALAALLHKSAIVMAPLGILSVSRNRTLSLLVTAAILPIAYFIFLAEHVDTLTQRYVTRQLDSGGASIRLLLGAITGICFLVFIRKYVPNPIVQRFWTLSAIASIAVFAALPVSPSTTALDRIALYFIPLQLVTIPVLPDRFMHHSRVMVSAIIIILFGAMLAIWLTTSSYAPRWVPYRTYLLCTEC